MAGPRVRTQPVVQANCQSAQVAPVSATCFRTELGWVAVAWSGKVVRGVASGYRSKREAERAITKHGKLGGHLPTLVDEDDLGRGETWVKKLVARLRHLAEGEPDLFLDVPLDLEHLTPFGRRVVAECRRIPWGRTRSYGDVAAECGSPGAARAVGSVMAKNRFPLIIPCHRVVGSGGSLGGYSGPEGLRMKQRLLAMEASDNT